MCKKEQKMKKKEGWRVERNEGERREIKNEERNYKV